MSSNLPGGHWPKAPTSWIEDKIVNISIPFTWNLPEVLSSVSTKPLPCRITLDEAQNFAELVEEEFGDCRGVI